MSRRTRYPALAGICLCVSLLALAACGPAASSGSVTSPEAAASSKPGVGGPRSAGYVGYDWLVVAISHDGKVTSIPPRLNVDLRFSRDGRFGADDPVNFHDGAFRVIRDGFTTGTLAVTAVGYAGHDSAVLLSVSAITSFDNGARAEATLTGDRLVVRVASYTLTCRRHGPAGNV